MSARSTSHLSEGCNLAVVTGQVAPSIVVRDLPDGSTVTQFDVVHVDAGKKRSVPVAALDDVAASIEPGDDVLVVGRVERRFFRVGGSTQSRTEVAAAQAIPLRRRRTAERTLADCVERLSAVL